MLDRQMMLKSELRYIANFCAMVRFSIFTIAWNQLIAQLQRFKSWYLKHVSEWLTDR